MTTEELRELAPDLPNEQFAAITRAEVVIVNPDHYSVVIGYNPDGSYVVLAKGIDAVALQMQAVARNSGISVASSPELARALYAQVGVGEVLAGDFAAQVANLIQGLTPAVPAPGVGSFTPGSVGTTGAAGGGLIGPQLIIPAAIVAAAVTVPIVAANDKDEHDQPKGS
jgi:type III secretion system FlhB-like substrate exporter